MNNAEAALHSIFSAMKCCLQTLADDMQLSCTLLFAQEQQQQSMNLSPSTSAICYEMMVRADSKLQADTAAFMRLALYMYTIMEAEESGGGGFAYYECPIHVMQEMVHFVDSFVVTKVDPAILSIPSQTPPGTVDVLRNFGNVREQVLLLANTLRAMVRETMALTTQVQQQQEGHGTEEEENTSIKMMQRKRMRQNF